MVRSIGDAEVVAIHLSNEDKRVFVQYAMTMLNVQRFEMALKQYASLRTETPEDLTYEQAWQALQKILRSTVRPLTDRLKGQGGLSEELLKELPEAAERRNTLAHWYLLRYAIRKRHGGLKPKKELEFLCNEDAYFETLFAKLRHLSGELRLQQVKDPDAPYVSPEVFRGIRQAMEAEYEADDTRGAE